MLTLYQLKQNGCFRCFYKSPYYIKNVFLMLVLGFLLTLIYLIYFRPDGGNLSSALKILKGLNSNTFNYLESNSGTLMVDKDVPMWKKGQTITTIGFFSTCVRLNKPCVIQGLASEWLATKEWGADLN